MRKLFAYISLVIIMAPSLLNLSVITDYAIRYDYYVNVLCENKDNPISQCHGKCQLAMTEQSSSNEEPAIPNLKELEIEVFFASESDNQFYLEKASTTNRCAHDENGLLEAYILPDLKPPRV